MGCKVLRFVALAMPTMIQQNTLKASQTPNIPCFLPHSPVAACASVEYNGKAVANHLVVNFDALIVDVWHGSSPSGGVKMHAERSLELEVLLSDFARHYTTSAKMSP